MSGTLPEWLVERLREQDPDGITRGARLGTCGRCGHPVLRGLDGDVCASAATVTPIELDHYGEYLALARGLRTYSLAARFSASGGRRWELEPRDRWQIENPRRRYAVVPQHGCGIWLPHWTDGELAKLKRPSAELDGPPPF